jgi:hypothetical protein
MTDKQIEKIKGDIRSLRAKLSAEKRLHGAYDDSRGFRYIIPDLYLQIKDYKGAYRYFNWYEKEFENDFGFPDFNLAWTITLFKNKKYDLAVKKAYSTAFSNTYLFDLIFDNKPLRINKSETINCETLDFVLEIEKYWRRMLPPDFIDWLKSITSQPDFKRIITDYIDIKRLIEKETNEDKRMELFDIVEKFKTRYSQ